MQWSDVRLTSVLSLYAVYKETTVLCQLVIRSASLCFSLVNSLSTWHCPHLLLSAVLRRRCCWTPLSINISCPHGAQQQTRLAPLLQSNMALSTLAAKIYFLIQMLQAASGKIMRLQQRRAAGLLLSTCRQEISIDSGGAAARRSAANAGGAMLTES